MNTYQTIGPYRLGSYFNAFPGMRVTGKPPRQRSVNPAVRSNPFQAVHIPDPNEPSSPIILSEASVVGQAVQPSGQAVEQSSGELSTAEQSSEASVEQSTAQSTAQPTTNPPTIPKSILKTKTTSPIDINSISESDFDSMVLTNTLVNSAIGSYKQIVDDSPDDEIDLTKNIDGSPIIKSSSLPPASMTSASMPISYTATPLHTGKLVPHDSLEGYALDTDELTALTESFGIASMDPGLYTTTMSPKAYEPISLDPNLETKTNQIANPVSNMVIQDPIKPRTTRIRIIVPDQPAKYYTCAKCGQTYRLRNKKLQRPDQYPFRRPLKRDRHDGQLFCSMKCVTFYQSKQAMDSILAAVSD